MIVIHHTRSLEVFGFTQSNPESFAWEQGVSFFFVLSGFILCYVYPVLSDRNSVLGFWRARIARVWPAVLFSFLIAFLLLDLKWDTPIAISNLLLLNAWIPNAAYFYSYNSPSWSVSTELFFYLVFPALISNWEKNWRQKVCFSIVLLGIVFIASNLMQTAKSRLFDLEQVRVGLLYISPITRIFEFTFGIFLAFSFRKRSAVIIWSKGRATSYEVIALLFVFVSLVGMRKLGAVMEFQFGELAFSHWLSFAGAMFSFGALIYVMALQRGLVSAFLSGRFLVFLGEISFSLYLLHQIFLRYFIQNRLAFPVLPDIVAFAIYACVLGLSSFLMWALIEIPIRKVLIGDVVKAVSQFKSVGGVFMGRVAFNRSVAGSASLLALLVIFLSLSFDHSALNYLARKQIPATLDSLTFFAASGDSRVVKILVAAGVDIDGLDSRGSNALIEASWNGKEATAQALLTLNASTSRSGSQHLTALRAAISQGHIPIARMLLKHGADPNDFDLQGNSLLMDAAWNGDLKLVSELLESGADFRFRHPKTGFTAMKAAASRNNESIVKVLRAAGAAE
jgi:peptidoglycan/LPS O-acetylase OafA/YrhL